MQTKTIFAGAVALFFGLALAPRAQAEDAAAFYAGKQVTFLIPTTVGGGFDLYSRTLMEFMRKYIPGRPTIVMQNMPGAGGVRAASYMFNVVPKDGSTFGMPLSNIPLAEALEPEAAKYRSIGFTWIGTITPETEILAVWKKTGVATLEDTKTKELAIGATGKLGTLALNAGLVKALLGSKFKIILGYPAGNEVNLAMENGEVQGRTNQWTSWKSQRPKWIEDGLLSYLLQIGPKEKELPQVPGFLDLVKAPRDQAVVRLLQSNQLLGRSIYGPPGMPADRLAVLRDAFEKTMRDPEFLARMKSLDLEVNPRPGDALQAEIASTMEHADWRRETSSGCSICRLEKLVVGPCSPLIPAQAGIRDHRYEPRSLFPAFLLSRRRTASRTRVRNPCPCQLNRDRYKFAAVLFRFSVLARKGSLQVRASRTTAHPAAREHGDLRCALKR